MLDQKDEVFVNRTLNLKKIKYLGFDMDHTLVRYDSHAFEELVHNKAIEILISNYQYPEAIRNIPFEYERIIRGLVIDKKRGNLLKINLHGYIRQSCHGTHLIDYNIQKTIYRGAHLDLGDDNYIPVDTAFSVAFGNLFAHLVDLKDNGEHELPAYSDIAVHILECVDTAHRDGSIKSIVSQNLEKFILQDPQLVEDLERFKIFGKKLFVLTNSEYEYCKALLDYTITPFLKQHKHWSELFEYTIALASKPRFFYDKLRFYKINPEDGTMRNTHDIKTPGIYQGGCAQSFTDDLNMMGDDILYVGDHIYGDILRLKKDCNWRTALVIEELGDEITKSLEAKPIQLKIQALMDKKAPLEKSMMEMEDKHFLENNEKYPKESDPDFAELQEIDKQISQLIIEHARVFNSHWGAIMRAGNEESYLAGQIARFACVYTQKLGNLLRYSPRTYFRSFRRDMPHEL